MPFQDMMKDTIALIKPTGERYDNMRASVQGNKVFYMQAKPVIEPGDEIIRVASNGLQERMTVIDPGFHEAFHGIPAHYQMTVQKSNGFQPAKSAQQLPNVIYNLNGDNARINHSSVDNSVNVVNRQQESANVIAALRDVFAKANIPAEELELAKDTLDVVEAQFESGKPKASIVSRMLDTLPKVAEAAEAVGKLYMLSQNIPT